MKFFHFREQQKNYAKLCRFMKFSREPKPISAKMFVIKICTSLLKIPLFFYVSLGKNINFFCLFNPPSITKLSANGAPRILSSIGGAPLLVLKKAIVHTLFAILQALALSIKN